MTTPREDALAARIMEAHDRLWPPPSDAADPSEEWVAESWAARGDFEGEVRAALAAEAETPERQHYTAYVDGRQCHNCGLEPYRHDCPTGRSRFGHWVDLASPETAEALARALRDHEHPGSFKGTLRLRRDHLATWVDGHECEPAILAAWRETGR